MKIEVTVSGTGKGVPRITRKIEAASLAAAMKKVTGLGCATHQWKAKPSTDDDDCLDILDVCCVGFRDVLLERLGSGR